MRLHAATLGTSHRQHVSEIAVTWHSFVANMPQLSSIVKKGVLDIAGACLFCAGFIVILHEGYGRVVPSGKSR